ncbi:MAG TPA: hypothetical protein DDZ51_28070 [Planctomycetaceae bacterium]|nr:hypothetical protein [Planctomycetaceae bacterium]
MIYCLLEIQREPRNSPKRLMVFGWVNDFDLFVVAFNLLLKMLSKSAPKNLLIETTKAGCRNNTGWPENWFWIKT